MPNDSSRTRELGYNVPAIYLDMARSMVTKIKYYKCAEEEDRELVIQLCNSTFGMMAVSVIFSFCAIEAMCNAHLEDVYNGRDNIADRRMRLMEKCKSETSFSKMENKPLEEKIKILCYVFRIKTPCEKDQINWQKFMEVVKLARNFMAHPNPASFPKVCSLIMEENKAGVYVEVAQNILRHFYVETGTEVPPWINQSYFFKCRGIELIDPNSRDS